MSDKPRCAATTKAGEPCDANPLNGTQHCLAHSPAEVRASVGFVAEAGKLGGRPKQPRVVDIIREKLEAEVDEWMATLSDARDAREAVSVGFGKDAYLEMVPDHRTRLKAFEMALDRAYGKPKQTTEVSGPEGGPVQLSAPLDDRARSAQAAGLLKDLGEVHDGE